MKEVMSKSTNSAAAQGMTSPERLRSAIKSARKTMRNDKGLNGELDRLPILTWLMFLKFIDDMDQQREIEAQLSGTEFKPLLSKPYRWRDWASSPNPTGEELLHFINSDETPDPFSNEQHKIPGLFSYLRNLSRNSDGSDARKEVLSTVFAGVDIRMKSGFLLKDVISQVNTLHFDSSEELHTLGALYEGMLREMRDAAGDSGEFYTPRPVVKFMVKALDPRLGEVVLDPACGTGGFLVEAFLHLATQVDSVQKRQILQSQSVRGAEPKSLPYLLCQMNLILHGLDEPQVDTGNSLRFKLTDIGDADRVDVILTNPPFGGEEEKGIQANFPNDKQTSETAVLFLQLIMRRLKRNGKGRAAVIVPNSTLFETGVTARVREDLLRNFNLQTIVRLPKGVFEPYTDIETNVLFFDTETPGQEVRFCEVQPPEGRNKYSKTLPLKYEDLEEVSAILDGRLDQGPNTWKVSISEILSDKRITLDLHNPNRTHSFREKPEIVASKTLARVRAVAGMLEKLQDALDEIKSLSPLNVEWVEFELGDILNRRKDSVDIEDGVTYKRLTIKGKGQGVSVRDEVDGSKIGTKKQFQVSAGMFLLSKIDARFGAFGLIPEEGDGAIITGNFWAYDCDERKLFPRLLVHLTRSDAFVEWCRLSSPGMTNRRYLQEPLFLKQRVRLPRSNENQAKLCQALDYVEAVMKELKRAPSGSDALLQSTLSIVFGEPSSDYEASQDDLTAEFRTLE